VLQQATFPRRYRVVTALSLTLPITQSLTRYDAGNNLVGPRAGGPRSQLTEGEPMPRNTEPGARKRRAPRQVAGLPGRRGSSIPAVAATWRTRS
jgi:hypothetical protein